MEFIKVASNGQWTLHKSDERDPNYANSPDMDMMSFKPASLEGRLPEDRGNQGELHNVGNARAPRQNSNNKMVGKVPNPIKSALRERKPSLT